jgi:hypothetical protein
MQMKVQPDANVVLHPVIQNRRPAGLRARKKEIVTAEVRIPDMSNRMNSY